jgi:lysozyme family protein
MNLLEQVRAEISHSIATLRLHYAKPGNEAEKNEIMQALESLNRKLSTLEHAALLQTADLLYDAIDELEKAIAAARYTGDVAALQEHLRKLYSLSGEIHDLERLPPAPDETPLDRGGSIPGVDTRGVGTPLPIKDYARLKDEYAAYYDACQVRPQHKPNVAYYAKRLNQKRPVYEQVGHDIGNIPWAFIGVIHGMECGFNFACHLHNGDPLTARTVCVPANRPAAGSPPFSWRESAVDALTWKGFHKVTDWSVPHMLYLLEKYNGFGYRMRRVATPYLWSFSNLYLKGKYVKDGVFDPEAVSKQCGAAVMLKAAFA